MYFFIDIEPQAKQSTRFANGRAYTPKKKADYVKEVKRQLKKQAEFNGFEMIPKEKAVFVSVLFGFSYRKKDKEDHFHSQRPDIDNLCKMLFDSMSDIVFHDDGQISKLEVEKKRLSKSGISIEVTELKND